jgi:hypothetical protein
LLAANKNTLRHAAELAIAVSRASMCCSLPWVKAAAAMNSCSGRSSKP